MRKVIFFFSTSLLALTTTQAQNNKSKFFTGFKPYAEVAYAAGLCASDVPVMFMAGAQKPFGMHWSLGVDLQFMSNPYEMYCCDMYSVGKYTTFIPSVKLNFDPGKRNKGFFAGIGFGYVVAHDRGTEQPYIQDAETSEITLEGKPANGNWDFNSISPSFNYGVTFRVARVPFSIVNTTYFGISEGDFLPIAVGIGFRVNFMKVPKK